MLGKKGEVGRKNVQERVKSNGQVEGPKAAEFLGDPGEDDELGNHLEDALETENEAIGLRGQLESTLEVERKVPALSCGLGSRHEDG